VSTPIENFVSRLNAKRSGKGWVANCPAHDDRKPSLNINEGADGSVLLKCHAGCPVDRIVGALNLTMKDLFRRSKNQRSKRSIVRTYDYVDRHGKLLFQTVRYQPKDFKQRRPDPFKAGDWIWNLKGVQRVLYRLPEVKSAVAVGETIYIAEGEKDVDALVMQGSAATCNPLGAKRDGSTWARTYTKTLRGAANVVVIADKDEIGRRHARVIAAALHRVTKSVKVIELPNRGALKIKDAHDFFAAGGTADELRAIVESAPEFIPASKSGPTKADSAAIPLAMDITPAQWCAERFPTLADEYGEPISEEADKRGIVSARDIGEDFFAATLGEKGSPAAPTIFLPTEEKFYTYAPSEGIFAHRREPTLLAQLSRLLLDCARACKDTCETRTLEFRFRDSANLSGVLRKARGLLEVAHDFFSTELTEFIPCANGMLRLKDKTLLPFNSSYRRRNKLAVAYDPTAKCAMFFDVLMCQALGTDELDLLQRWCGLALIGENLAQRILILSGTAGGGKGTFIRVLNGIIGQTNLASLRPQLLGERFELGRFLGRTLLYGADVPANFLDQRGASVLKSLTGYDPVTLEFKNSNESPSIICRFNVIVTCNSRLAAHLEGDVEAWRRRLAIIEYRKPKPEKIIADLDRQILKCEGSGVLNWMLAGLDKLRADSWQLRLTTNQLAAVDNLLLESDGHAVFARECLKRDAMQTLTLPDCFAAYVEFCTQRGWTALTRNKFTPAISDEVVRQFGITPRNDIPDNHGKQQRGWKGLAVTENFVRPTAKTASEASASELSDTTDTLFSVQSAKIPAGEKVDLVEELI
jgi:putative DNA primase/helicase